MIRKRILSLESEIANLTAKNQELKTTVAEVLVKNQELEQCKWSLNEELKSLKRSKNQDVSREVETVLSRYFSPGQIRCILRRQRKIHWAAEDIASAISLKSVSAKAYRYLRNKLNYPLPHISTLRKWAQQFMCDTGVLCDVLALMKSKSKELTNFEKIAVLSFDEIKISNKISLDRKNEQVVGPHNYAQVVMARSLLGQWKQPIYYDFDKPMTEEILKDIIVRVEESGFKVVAIVSDMGGGNRAVWKRLGITPEKTAFVNPYDNSRNIFVFADVPHLIKLARNHFLDKGFTVEGNDIDKEYVQQLINNSKHELKIAPKVTQRHLDVVGCARQKVKPAVQLFSNSVSTALLFLQEKKLITGNATPTANFIKTFNDWFDVFNSSRPSDAYGTNIAHQDTTLNNMTHLMETARARGIKRKLPFQEGIQISNKSLQDLFRYLQTSLGVSYITTVKLNQDILECFFSYIRAMGRENSHPTAVDFKYRIRNYILGKHSAAIFSEKQNTKDREEETCLTSDTAGTSRENTVLSRKDSNEILLHKEMEITKTLQDLKESVDYCEEDCALDMETCIFPGEVVPHEALQYIAGYVAHRFRNQYPELGGIDLAPQPINWIQYLSRGGLVTPSDKFMRNIVTAEGCFMSIHGNDICKEKNIFRKVTDAVVHKIGNSIPHEVVQCFVRTRTFIKIKELNAAAENILSENRRKRIKMRKIVN